MEFAIKLNLKIFKNVWNINGFNSVEYWDRNIPSNIERMKVRMVDRFIWIGMIKIWKCFHFQCCTMIKKRRGKNIGVAKLYYIKYFLKHRGRRFKKSIIFSKLM